MDPELRKILDAIPEKPPRSRLEPYREFIEELRRKGRTYRDISAILEDKCQVKVTASGIHDFTRARASSRFGRVEKFVPDRAHISTVSAGVPAERKSEAVVQDKIKALKARVAPVAANSASFAYDPDEPLRFDKQQVE